MKQRQRIEHSFGSQLLSAAVAAPVAIGLAALGAVVSVTQWVLAAVTSHRCSRVSPRAPW